jgi:hypothetical protein
MSSMESRLMLVEHRIALQDVLTAFCNAVDSLSDMGGLLNCFMEDAVFDLTALMPLPESLTGIHARG